MRFRLALTFFVLILSLNVADALTFTQNFQGVTIDFPYPNGQMGTCVGSDHCIRDSENVQWESLAPTDFFLLQSVDGYALPTSSSDTDCKTIAGAGSAHSHAGAAQVYYFNVDKNASSVNLNIYMKLEGNGAGTYCTNWWGIFCVGDWEDGYIEWHVEVLDPGGGICQDLGSGSLSEKDWVYGYRWFNYSVSTGCIDSNGQLTVRIRVESDDGNTMYIYGTIASWALARIYTDYIEVVADTATATPVCVDYQSYSTLPADWKDVVGNETVNLRIRAYEQGTNNNVPNYPVKVYVEDEYGREQFVGVGVTDSNGITPYVRIVGGEAYRANFTRVEAFDSWMANGKAYIKSATCGDDSFTPPSGYGKNIAIVPASYTLDLVGRMYYPGGIDWARFVFYTHDSSVERYRNIPISQKITNKTASISVWKYGFDYQCTDNSVPCNKEGIYASDSGPFWNPACVVIGDRDYIVTPFCDRSPMEIVKMDIDVLFLSMEARVPNPGCYVDTDPYGNPVGEHRCGLFYGYRVGPLIQMAFPDNALGYTPQQAINSTYGSLAGLMSTTTYSAHEGPDEIHVNSANVRVCGQSATVQAQDVGSTEYTFTHPITLSISVFGIGGSTTIQPDTKGGLGMIGFIGLYGDQDHVVGLILGHRFGIHPFIALVQTVPEYPTTQAGWQNYEERWLYYLFENLRFIAETWGNEMSIWNYRYGSATNQANLVRSFEDLIVEFTPFLRATLDLMVAAPKNLVYPFIVSTFLQLEDFGHLMKVAFTNQTIFNKSVEAAAALMTALPGILGPPPP
ncbi:MAG TPA: hypothetical protein ENG14_05820, partial [Thermodesulforhabdus norvegica]|nr:hypothetical protein [Thermodesulforhabdus norvegica]